MRKGYLDRIQEKVISRKLLVFVTATVLLSTGSGLDADTWGWIALMYIGTQGAIDAIKVYRETKLSTSVEDDQ